LYAAQKQSALQTCTLKAIKKPRLSGVFFYFKLQKSTLVGQLGQQVLLEQQVLQLEALLVQLARQLLGSPKVQAQPELALALGLDQEVSLGQQVLSDQPVHLVVEPLDFDHPAVI
jgi:hypothetical protein